MRLWFENSDGEERVINEHVDNWMQVHHAIGEFINQCNREKICKSLEIYGDDFQLSKVKLFKWYYTRAWHQEDGRLRIDVGSHTEFFIWEGKPNFDKEE